MSEWEECINSFSQDSKGNWNMVKKKKHQNWDHPPLSPTMSRSMVKTDVGVKPKSLGRRSVSQVMQDEARKKFADGSKRTIKECSRKNK